MTKKLKGSNQHKNRYQFLKTEVWRDIWFIAFIVTLGVILLKVLYGGIISPCPDSGCEFSTKETVYAKDQSGELEEVLDYIVEKFEPEFGRDMTVRVIACAISESGLRPKAVNVNKNGTTDIGIFQINSVHGMSTEDRIDIYKNIDKAFEIFKRRGFQAWYGSYCK